LESWNGEVGEWEVGKLGKWDKIVDDLGIKFLNLSVIEGNYCRIKI
jgi:hypothetical protein